MRQRQHTPMPVLAFRILEFEAKIYPNRSTPGAEHQDASLALNGIDNNGIIFTRSFRLPITPGAHF